jgi:hypothetical protein
MHMAFAQIKLSPESCFSNMADYAAETVWVGPPQPFSSVGHVGQLATPLRKLSDCSITS